MSNKKFMNRTAFLLAIFAIIVTAYNLYESAVNHYRLNAIEVRLEHAESIIDTMIRSKTNTIKVDASTNATNK